MTTLINLFGGPGIGKSTTAAEIYSTLKNKDVNAELVREYVKGWAWEGRAVKPLDQLYFFGKQAHAETILLGKADVVITDSPLILAAMYLEKRGDKYWELAKYLYAASLEYYAKLREDGHRVVDVLLIRTKKYHESGRYETSEQAVSMDNYIQIRLERYGCDFDRCTNAREIIELAKA